MTMTAVLTILLAQMPLTTDVTRVASSGNGRIINASPECPIAGMRPLVGRRFDAATRVRARTAAGRHPLRWIMPDAMVTQDHVEDRVNAQVGRDGRIEALRCG